MLNREKKSRISVERVASEMFNALAQAFPVACASDEFFYFPQMRPPEIVWSQWDDFSIDSVNEITSRLSEWESELDRIETDDILLQIDLTLLKKLSCTLREQLSQVKVWRTHPTFYLTLACIGLADALQSEDPAAKHERADTMLSFLDQMSQNLDNVPVLFRDLGLEMISDTRNYFHFLHKTLPELHPALTALDRIEQSLRQVSTCDNFYLPPDMLEIVVRSHLNCQMNLPEINHLLDQEINEMQQILSEESDRIIGPRSMSESAVDHWLKAYQSIPVPEPSNNGMAGLYEKEVYRLAQHCLEKKLIPSALVVSSPVKVELMPSYLAAIRAASSYSIKPEYPAKGGTFYILNTLVSDDTKHRYSREYRMLSAHETWPGHHLLDSSRWNLSRLPRRFIEQPLFYEGWACFAEELMWITGYFSGPIDRLLLAKRRLWRAVRGKVDISMQTGMMDTNTAIKYLKGTGISEEQAVSAARKYPLNPGYQLCYTVGLRRFLDLFDRFGKNSHNEFVKNVLENGEVAFTDLERLLVNNIN